MLTFSFSVGIPGGQDADMVSVYSEYLEGEPDTYFLSPHDRGGVVVGGVGGAGGGAKTRHVNINAKPINSLDKVTVPISLVLTVMVGYICGGAILFGQWEGNVKKDIFPLNLFGYLPFLL